MEPPLSADEMLRQYNARREEERAQRRQVVQYNGLSVDEMIRQYHAKKAQERQVVIGDAGGIIPEQMVQLNQIDRYADLRQRLRQEVQPVRPIILTHKYADVPDINPDFTPVKHDFTDDELLKRSGYRITKGSDDELAELGRLVMPMLSRGFNTLGVIGLLKLAYNLKHGHGGRYSVMEDMDDAVAAFDRDASETSSVTYSSSSSSSCSIAGAKIPPTTDPHMESVYYCYIAASTLRLFTKPVDNYINAWENINKCLTGFYHCQAPIALPTPNREALEGLVAAFCVGSTMKTTLFKILYCANCSDMAKGLKEFLYDIHLANTGMHIAAIFDRLTIALNISSSCLLSHIHTNMFSRQMKALANMIKLELKNDEKHSRKMWRYGRIFNSNFMLDLGTKVCPKLVYMLACMLKIEEPTQSRNILNIVQFKDLDEEQKSRCSIVANNILRKIKEEKILRS